MYPEDAIDRELKELGDGTIFISDRDQIKANIYNFQNETLLGSVEIPVQFSDIDSFHDAGEYVGGVLANFAPQIIAMWATGGQSAWVMGASTAGGVFDEMQREMDI